MFLRYIVLLFISVAWGGGVVQVVILVVILRGRIPVPAFTSPVRPQKIRFLIFGNLLPVMSLIWYIVLTFKGRARQMKAIASVVYYVT
jgi:hypothetical protein